MAACGGIDLEEVKGVLTATLVNPARRNAFTRPMRRLLTDILDGASERADIRAIVITGADNHFCSGFDLSRPLSTDADAFRENMQDAHRLILAMTGNVKPIVAAVEGMAFGAGLSIALAADLIVASTTARFGAGFARVGLLPDMGLLHRLPLRVGRSTTQKMLMLSEVVDGTVASALGLVDRLVPAGDARTVAQDYAKQLVELAPLALSALKQALGVAIPTVEVALRIELDQQARLVQTADHQEGVRAFLEKRPPNFIGR